MIECVCDATVRGIGLIATHSSEPAGNRTGELHERVRDGRPLTIARLTLTGRLQPDSASRAPPRPGEKRHTSAPMTRPVEMKADGGCRR